MDNTNTQKKDQAMMDQAALISFVDKMIEDKKDPNLKSEDLPNVKMMLLQQVNEDINTHLIALLSEQDQLGLDDLLNKNASDDELNKFFMDKIPNVETEIAAVLVNFRNAYMMPLADIAKGQAPAVANGQSNQDVKLSPPPPPTPAPVNILSNQKLN